MKAPTSRAKRRMFAAKIDLTDVASGSEIIANTYDLSHSGCRLNQTRLAVGSKVRVCIIYREQCSLPSLVLCASRPMERPPSRSPRLNRKTVRP